MNFARAHNKWLEPPDEDPYCEDGCGDTLVRDIEGEWVCENRYCPKKFQGVEQEMAFLVAEYKDTIEYLRRQSNRMQHEINELKGKQNV
jgi:hypothetical protein